MLMPSHFCILYASIISIVFLNAVHLNGLYYFYEAVCMFVFFVINEFVLLQRE